MHCRGHNASIDNKHKVHNNKHKQYKNKHRQIEVL